MQLGRYRESCLQDLFGAARLFETLDHIHFCSCPLVAPDIADLRRLDLNTAYACLAGTQKHVFVSARNAAKLKSHLKRCLQMQSTKL